MAVSATRPAIRQPMLFGQVKSGDVRDPIIEPIWLGRRVLADVVGTQPAALTDEAGNALEGFGALCEEIGAANLASTLTVDGYLTTQIRDSVGLAVPDVIDGVASPGQYGRQFFLGGGGRGREDQRDRTEASLAKSAALTDEEDGAGFVAIDLLELDGESLLHVPLLERKRLLDSAFGESANVRRTPIVRAPADMWYGQWRLVGFVEMAFKAANGRYIPGAPSRDWAVVRIPKR